MTSSVLVDDVGLLFLFSVGGTQRFRPYRSHEWLRAAHTDEVRCARRRRHFPSRPEPCVPFWPVRTEDAWMNTNTGACVTRGPRGGRAPPTDQTTTVTRCEARVLMFYLSEHVFGIVSVANNPLWCLLSWAEPEVKRAQLQQILIFK